jgi:hypothetical protein
MTESKIGRFAREGRGTGEGVDYKPWLTVHDLSSKGRSARMLGRHNRRLHHLLSDIERGAFLDYDWRDDVQDIREQFPIDRGMTRVIAAEMGVRHPQDVSTKVDTVVTTDLLVTFLDGSMRAVACKASSDLRDARTLEKLEIERRYWSRLGVEWKLWTERSITKARVMNLAYLHEFLDVDDRRLVSQGHWVDMSALFLSRLYSADPEMPFAVFAEEFEKRSGVPPGSAIATMRYLACRKLLVFDIDTRFDPSLPLGRSLRLLRPCLKARAA